MKKITTLLCSVLLATGVFAQKFPVDTIISTGPADKRIKFVIMGDGYTASQQNKFIQDATTIANALFTKSPYTQYKPYFNVYAVKVPSNASGAGSTPSNPVDNYFGSTFGVGGTDRCLFASKEALVMSVAKDNVPGYAQIMLIVNTTKYGGCGSDDFCTLSMAPDAGDIGIHESGHTYGGLADEYWFQFSNQPNQSNTSNSSSIKWSKWMGVNGVGAYAYESPGSAYYRPHQDCEMRFLNKQFCYVCRDIFVSKYHKSVNMTESYLPTNLNLTMQKSDKQDFSVKLLAPIPNTLAVKWTLNGTTVGKNVSNISINGTQLNEGAPNEVIMSVKDTTSFVRVDHYQSIITETVKWIINIGTTGVSTIQSKFYKAGLDIYPNPVGNDFTAAIFCGDKYDNASLWMVDMSGKRIALKQNINLVQGENSVYVSAVPQTAAGVYMLQLEVDGTTVATQSLVKE